MEKFYFTFGTDKQFPFYGGWVEIHASSLNEAAKKFRAKYPDYHAGFVNCAFMYTEQEFQGSIMYLLDDNMGHGCWEVID